MNVDLVVLSLGGVQRFISESRTTADVANSSLIIQHLAVKAAHAIRGRLAEPEELIFPALPEPGDGVTSKIAFLARAGRGPALAAATGEVVTAEWRAMAMECFDAEKGTPGFPDVSWVSVTGSPHNFERHCGSAPPNLVLLAAVHGFSMA